MPDQFAFIDQTGVQLNTVITSNTITVTGINAAASISITGGTYSVNGGAYTSSSGTVNNGNAVTVRQTSSSSYLTITNATLTIGGVSDTFSVTTQSAPCDTMPNSFTFTDQTGVGLSQTVTSNAITVSGISCAAPISITGGTYSVNGGAYTSSSGTVNNGNTVTVRVTSSGSYLATVNATLTIGGVSDTFSVTTTSAPCDTAPNAFTLTDQTGVGLSQTITSNTITVSGISCAAPISITGGTYSVNGGAYTSSSGSVNNGNTVTVRVTSSGSYFATVNATLMIGGVSDTFSVTTQSAPPTAGSLQFSLSSYSVNENGGSAIITVTRTGGSNGAVGVNYATSNGTATAGSDYIATSGALSWSNGDASTKTFSIPILDDSVYEVNETVNLTLSSATGGATLGSPNTAVLTIMENDTAPNNPPVINPISDASIAEGTPYTGPTPALSQGTLPVTWSLVSGPSGMSINSSTGMVSWANPTVSGSPHTITIQATNAAGSDTESWLLTVTPAPGVPHCVNETPGLQAALTAAQSNSEDDIIMVVQGTYTGNFTYSSDEGHNITLLGGYIAGCAGRVVDPANTILDGNGSGLVLGLYNTNGGDIAVEGLTIRNGNNGAGIGGIDTWTTGNITFTSNIITGNTSSSAPGGVLAESGSVDSETAGDVTLANNIITANTAASGQGGGVAAWSHSKGTAGTITLVNNTCTGNTAAVGGGAYLGVSGSSGGMVNCYNNIIRGNTAPTGGDIYLSKGTGVAHAYNNDSSVTAGSPWDYSVGNIDADPLFDGGGDYHLQPLSPCVDAGLNSAPGLPANDFEGNARIIDGDKDGTAFVDMGADEYGSVITAETPFSGTIFSACSLINKYQPSFQWTGLGGSFKSFTILFSISSTDFSTKGVLITKANILGKKSSWTPSIGTWRKIMAASYNSGSVREIYWKVVGKRADKSTAESGVRYLWIDDPYYPEIQSPADGTLLPAATPPRFVFDTNCNVKFRLEISPLGGFSDSKKIKVFTYTIKDPNVTGTLEKTLSAGQWQAVKKLIGTGQGYFRIRAWDAIKRETASETRSFTIQ